MAISITSLSTVFTEFKGVYWSDPTHFALDAGSVARHSNIFVVTQPLNWNDHRCSYFSSVNCSDQPWNGTYSCRASTGPELLEICWYNRKTAFHNAAKQITNHFRRLLIHSCLAAMKTFKQIALTVSQCNTIQTNSRYNSLFESLAKRAPNRLPIPGMIDRAVLSAVLIQH